MGYMRADAREERELNAGHRYDRSVENLTNDLMLFSSKSEQVWMVKRYLIANQDALESLAEKLVYEKIDHNAIIGVIERAIGFEAECVIDNYMRNR